MGGNDAVFLIAAPEMLAAASADLATIDSSLGAAHSAAAAPTVALVPAGADEVSASIAHLFSQHAEDYQAVAGQAAAFHKQFIQNLNASARSYASTEAANTSSLRPLGASTGSHASASAGAQTDLSNLLVGLEAPLLPVNLTGNEGIALVLFLLTGQLELVVLLVLLVHFGARF